MHTIRKTVATACGLRENRENESVNLNDNISVAFIDFYSQPLAEPSAEGIQKWLSSPLAPFVLAFLAFIIILLIWLLIRRKAQKEEEEQEILSGFEAIAQEEISLAELMEQNMTPEEKERQRVRSEINRIITENPENAAQVLRTWLLEEQR